MKFISILADLVLALFTFYTPSASMRYFSPTPELRYRMPDAFTQIMQIINGSLGALLALLCLLCSALYLLVFRAKEELSARSQALLLLAAAFFLFLIRALSTPQNIGDRLFEIELSTSLAIVAGAVSLGLPCLILGAAIGRSLSKLIQAFFLKQLEWLSEMSQQLLLLSLVGLYLSLLLFSFNGYLAAAGCICCGILSRLGGNTEESLARDKLKTSDVLSALFFSTLSGIMLVDATFHILEQG